MSGSNPITRKRTTKETDISVSLHFQPGPLTIEGPIPFFNHMLHAMLFHGGWSGTIKGTGDTDVDYHHLVEDIGIVLGSVFSEYAVEHQPIQRFGHAVTPMDDALAEVSVDFSQRAYLHYNVTFPQSNILSFSCALLREFFTALAHNARINLHITLAHGLNSHHIAESVFKSTGRAIFQALQSGTLHRIPSTKEVL